MAKEGGGLDAGSGAFLPSFHVLWHIFRLFIFCIFGFLITLLLFWAYWHNTKLLSFRPSRGQDQAIRFLDLEGEDPGSWIINGMEDDGDGKRWRKKKQMPSRQVSKNNGNRYIMKERYDTVIYAL